MKDFLHRTVTTEAEVFNEDGDKIMMRAWRTRANNGHRMIGVEFGTQRIEFTMSDDYEQHARKLIELLDQVCSHPCALPKTGD